MPEAYTHIRTARLALQQSGVGAADTAAYEMGANGPDPLFAYHVLQSAKKRPYDLAALGERMHEEETGRFLRAMVFRAWSEAQRSYVLGFLSHYAADSTLHPYVEALCAEGGPFAGPYGHGFCEVALDSDLHEQDGLGRAVPAQDAAPALSPQALAEIVELLHACILEVYGMEVSREALADSFHDFIWLHGMFCAGAAKRFVIRVVQALMGKPGWGMSHVTPAKAPDGGFPEEWENPFTHAPQQKGPQALLAQAQELAGQYQKAASAYWEGVLDKVQLAAVLGDRSYVTGLLSRSVPKEKTETMPT